MSTRSRKPSQPQEAALRCAKCGHLETEHGRTGTRPCLATVGDLADREFCSCDEFGAKLSRAQAA